MGVLCFMVTPPPYYFVCARGIAKRERPLDVLFDVDRTVDMVDSTYADEPLNEIIFWIQCPMFEAKLYPETK